MSPAPQRGGSVAGWIADLGDPEFGGASSWIIHDFGLISDDRLPCRALPEPPLLQFGEALLDSSIFEGMKGDKRHLEHAP